MVKKLVKVKRNSSKEMKQHDGINRLMAIRHRLRQRHLLWFLVLVATVPLLLFSINNNNHNNNNNQQEQQEQSFTRGFLRWAGTLTTTTTTKDSASTSTSTSTKKGCSSLQQRLIAKSLPNAQTIIEATICPENDKWLSDYLLNNNNNNPSLESHHQSPPQDEFVFLNFGCNKGFDAIQVANTVSKRSDVFKKSKWFQALGIDQKGSCNQAIGNDVIYDSSFPKQAVQIHCIEAMPATFRLLQLAAAATTAEHYGMHIHNYAMTSKLQKDNAPNGMIPFPNVLPGTENRGIAHCSSENHPAAATEHCQDVPAMTIDEFVTKHVDNNNNKSTTNTNTKKRRRIPYISIDVEGGDYTVLMGATQTLKRTDYLEFEYHAVGDWKQQKLQNAIDMLAELGFVCYWAGKKRLWRITDCWMDHFEFHQWSNVACVSSTAKQAQKLYQTMEQVFEDTLVDGTSGGWSKP
ncbi:expressed unknown protein [Seminavis robusta]|uniref:Methyltransferase FkbM domain-containing protein n=1 Tax=Seminavis robusta TaxID=568900 RepID=A0A9N8EFB6_9STRA|nr:expressed unknown protein [Seminavis robusta]|eukprot:Sro861_g212270.1 n/a (462) ;mRNA; r:25153-26538